MQLGKLIAALFVTGVVVGAPVRDAEAQSRVTGRGTAVLASAHVPVVHVVHLVGYSYDPGDIAVRAGDTVRFVQDGAMPHNVEFHSTPATAALGDARVGPYLLKEGDIYDLVIDQRFPAGVYQFACTPHQALGMKGTLTVR